MREGRLPGSIERAISRGLWCDEADLPYTTETLPSLRRLYALSKKRPLPCVAIKGGASCDAEEITMAMLTKVQR